MSNVIDRRLNGKGKSSVNRERFLKRCKSTILDSVGQILHGQSVSDVKGGDVKVPKKTIDEPHFHTGSSGDRDLILPGNEVYQKGDLIRRPNKNGGASGRNGSNSKDILEDEFLFTLSKEEFMDIFFSDMELPDLEKKTLIDPEKKLSRAGFTSSGTSSNLHILRSLKSAIGRKSGIKGTIFNNLIALEKEIAEKEALGPLSLEERDEYDKKRAKLRKRLANIPFIDPVDIRYRNFEHVDTPTSKVVMMCIMDVSASMGVFQKEIAKRFFILMNLFLQKNYEKVELVFIRHTTEAEEVTEYDFFYGRTSGGTIVSSALEMAAELIKTRYSPEEYNIYITHATDGDNYDEDNKNCTDILVQKLLPQVQGFFYLEIIYGWHESTISGDLWDSYTDVKRAFANLKMCKAIDVEDVYPALRRLFKSKKGSSS